MWEVCSKPTETVVSMLRNNLQTGRKMEVLGIRDYISYGVKPKVAADKAP